MLKALDHITINLKDVEKSLDFYGNVLGLKRLPDADMGDHYIRYFAIPGGTKLELIEYFFETPEEKVDAMNRGCARHFAFEAEDIRALEKRLQDAGYKFHSPVSYVEKLDFTGGLIMDPNGFELELLQPGKH